MPTVAKLILGLTLAIGPDTYQDTKIEEESKVTGRELLRIVAMLGAASQLMFDMALLMEQA